MKTNFRRWIPATTNRTNSVVLGLAALAVVGGLAGGTASAAVAAPEAGTVTVADHASDKQPSKKAKATAGKDEAAKTAPAAKSLKHSFQLQSTYYFCAPSATRVALSAHGKVYQQAKVADLLGTTTDGTDSAHVVTGVLNKQLGKDRYHTVEIPGQKATAKQIAQLKTDAVTAINQGDPVVANVAGTATDRNGDAHSYEGGHYIPVVGYSDHGNVLKIADSADTEGSAYYTVSAKTLGNWIASRGYSA